MLTATFLWEAPLSVADMSNTTKQEKFQQKFDTVKRCFGRDSTGDLWKLRTLSIQISQRIER